MAKPLILLASQSPRRREILKFLGIPFQSTILQMEETPHPELSAWEQPEFLARAKAEFALKHLSERPLPVLCADTLVIQDEQILGKAKDRSHARSMLQSLQGRSHKVRTGIALLDLQGQIHSAVCETHVQFRPLSLLEINAYLDTMEYTDKAGSYGIQGYGARLVEKIDGCYYNVMGLPVQNTLQMLRKYL